MNGSSDDSRAKICIVVAVPWQVNVFMSQHIVALSHRYRVTLALNGSKHELRPELRGITLMPIPIVRPISPLRDLLALFVLWRLFRRERFDIVQSMSPKAGLLSAVAGRVAGVPIRIHWITGQIWGNKRGLMRVLLKTMDRITARCATNLLADSPSQVKFLVEENNCASKQVEVLGSGSTCGVDMSRFHPDPVVRARVRKSLGIPDDATIALFLGRKQPEKGIPELCEAFLSASKACPKIHLLMVGPDEAGMEEFVRNTLAPVADNLSWIGLTSIPEEYLVASDFLVLPSHREGFGSVVIEAAACGIPSIGTNIYGLSDAIIDGETGILVPIRNTIALEVAIKRLALDACERVKMGERAIARVSEKFSQEVLVNALLDYYSRLLTKAKTARAK